MSDIPSIDRFCERAFGATLFSDLSSEVALREVKDGEAAG